MEQGEKYIWTRHAQMKLRHYRLTESRIKRVIRHPARIEKGILPRAVAAMSPADGKKYSEIWTMYVLVKSKIKGPADAKALAGRQMSKVKVITAWRYPGRAPERDPVPPEILREVRKTI